MKGEQEESYVPFREYIPAGQSTFSIEVPLYFADREFFFSYLLSRQEFFPTKRLNLSWMIKKN
jgi:hypothetical protein